MILLSLSIAPVGAVKISDALNQRTNSMDGDVDRNINNLNLNQKDQVIPINTPVNEISNWKLYSTVGIIPCGGSFPIAENMSLTTNVGSAISGVLKGYDADGDNLTYFNVSNPQYGILSMDQSGKFVYTPNMNFSGVDSFQYKVNDGNPHHISNIATVTINVNKNDSSLSVDNITAKVGEFVNMTAKLVDDKGNVLSNRQVIFKLNGKICGDAITDENGIAVLNYQLDNGGNFKWEAIYNGDNVYKKSTVRGFLNAEKIGTKLTVANINGKVGNIINLTANLFDDNGKPLIDKIVTFKVNGKIVGKTITNYNGDATLIYQLNKIGKFKLETNYEEDNVYKKSTANGFLNVEKTKTKLTVANINGKVGHSVNLKATLFDDKGNPMINRKLTFIVNGKIVGSVFTNEKGIAVFRNFQLQTAGKKQILVTFKGDGLYDSSHKIGILNIQKKIIKK